jgi:hypothetical protein
MEEILASIRRIISEDDAPPAQPTETPQAEQPPAAVEPETKPEPVAAAPAPAPASETVDEEDDLELTEKVETHGDLDIYTPTPPVEPPPAPAPVAAAAVAPLVSDRAAQAAASAFGQLSAAMAMPAEGRTLEDVVRELLRPLLQQWLDDNLPGIVQQSVEAEVARIARGRVR